MSKARPRFGRAWPILLAVGSGLLLLVSLQLPLWHMRLEAPQYQGEEALKVTVFPNRYGGDMREISVLNQYIGVHVPNRLPQFEWLPPFLAGCAALAAATGLFGFRFRRPALAIVSGILAVGILGAVVQAKCQMHDIGHKRDQRTILAGMHDFTPPFLGTSKIAQFTVTSRLGAGAWAVGAAIGLQLVAAWLSRKPSGAPAQAASEQPAERTSSVETGQLVYTI